METINIVELVENNPITKLSSDYNVKHCYLYYNPINDFVIDLYNIWERLEYNQKIKVEKILQKYFAID